MLIAINTAYAKGGTPPFWRAVFNYKKYVNYFWVILGCFFLQITGDSYAGTITWGNTTDGQIYFSNGQDFPTSAALAASGVRFEIGVFDSAGGFNLSTSSPSEWRNHWHPLDILGPSDYSSPQPVGGGDFFTGTFNVERVGSVIRTSDNGGAPAYDFTPGSKFYYWISNSNDIENGAEWALFTADHWTLPTSADLSLFHGLFRIPNTGFDVAWGGVGSFDSDTMDDRITVPKKATANFSLQTAVLSGPSIGNRVWLDNDGDGQQDATEFGIPGVSVQLWSPGANGLEENGGGDDVQIGAAVQTDIDGHYAFENLAEGAVYVRIPSTPVNYPRATISVNADNRVNTDSNGIQSTMGAAVRSPIIMLNRGAEPSNEVDGNSINGDFTVDFGFQNPDRCYSVNLIDNASFEFNGSANTNGTSIAELGYDGAGMSFGANVNALRWVGGVNGVSPFNAPIQRMQVLAVGATAKVSWVESLKARAGKRYVLLEGTNSCIDLRAFAGGEWSSALQPGKTYEVALWADTASAADASFNLTLEAGANIFSVANVDHQYFIATQQLWNGAPATKFSAADYNGWNEATANNTRPNWRKFTFRFSIPATATAAQIDQASLIIAAGTNSGPIAIDDMYLCDLSVPIMSIGNRVWLDNDGDGLQDANEPGVPGLAVQLWSPGANAIAENGAGDDVQIGASKTTDINGGYVFNQLLPGMVYVRIPSPPAFYPQATVSVNSDNGIANDSNGIQSASGAAVNSPVINLSTDTEPDTAVDGDGRDGDLTVDFGFRNPDPCYAFNLIDNASFELNGSPNTNGAQIAALGYDGAGMSFGAGVNALRWVGSVNGVSPFNAPIQRMQVLAVGAAAKVGWVESFKARAGKRYVLLEGTNSCLDLRAFGGGNWSAALQAGKTYEVALWADTASSTDASFNLTLEAGASLFRVDGVNYQYYIATQQKWIGSPATKFSAADYNGWNEATANNARPNWRKFTFRFSIPATATAAQIDQASLIIAAGTNSGPIAVDDMYMCEVAAQMCVGNQVWVDMNNDGVRQSVESGIPGLPIQLWTAGADGVVNNGSGDDAVVRNSDFTDANGQYLFENLQPGSYYVRIPTVPVFFPQVSANGVALDNNINNDSNALQPGGSGTAVHSALFTLTAGAEPGTGVDGDGTDCNSTIDLGFANLDPCYVTNLFDNPSFEVSGTANATGVATRVLGFTTGVTFFGNNLNALQWTGGVTGNSGLGSPIQRVEVLPGNNGSKVSWVDSFKPRHGRRMLLLQGTNSCVSMRATGGGAWSSVLQAGHEYELSAWAANASAATASVIWDLGAQAQVFQIITGGTPGVYQYFTVPQSAMDGTPRPAFTAGDYSGWSDASPTSSPAPVWRQFKYRFRIAATATPTQIDTASFVFSGGSSTNPIVADYLSLCEVPTSATLTLGNLVWNDANRDGVRNTGANGELGVPNVAVALFTTANTTIGDADDMLVATTTTTATGDYNFTGLIDGFYYVRVTPNASYPATGGNVVTSDNQINNDNNGAQPGGPGTPIYSPVITLTKGLEPTNDGDTDPDTELSVDFGLFTGIQLGDQLFHDANNDGIFTSSSESTLGPGVKVELLNSAGTLITDTLTNSSGIYSFLVFTPGQYRLRVPTPPAATPLVSGIADNSDNGENNDSNALQPAGQGTAALSPLITLTAGGEPGSTGATNVENTIDFGFRACPAITLSPGTLALATQYANYNLSLNSFGGAGGYVYSITSGSLPAGMTLSPAGLLSGIPGAAAAPGNYPLVIRSTDNTGCYGQQSYTLRLFCPTLTITPSTLPPSTQYSSYSQPLLVASGTAPYTWSASPAPLTGAVAWWPGEGGGAEVMLGNTGALFGGMGFNTGRIAQAFAFDGADDYVQVADHSSQRPANLTVEAWVYAENGSASGNRVLVAKTADLAGLSSGYGLIQTGGGSQVRFFINGNASTASSEFVEAALTANAWHHVTVTYDRVNLNLCIDGALAATKPFAAALVHNNVPLVMGGSSTAGTAWQGKLDEVILYNRALSVAEASARYAITQNLNNGVPAGISVSTTTGEIAGTPTAAPADYPFTVRVADVYGCLGVRSYTLRIVCPQISITPATLVDAKQYVPYSDVNFQATGGTASYSWSISSGAMPTGMTFSTAGVLGGTPGSVPGLYTFTVRARDANNCTGERQVTLLVKCPTITLTPTTLSDAKQFTQYTAVQFQATGGNAPYTFAVASGSTLPAGMLLSNAGLLSGTPTAPPGDHTFTIRATDGSAAACTGDVTVTLRITCPDISIGPASLPVITQYTPYSQNLSATGGNDPYTWTLVNGALPAGITLNSAGQLAGTTSAAPGVYNFRVRASDTAACSAEKNMSVAVECSVIDINPKTLPPGKTTTAYSQQLTATGGTAPYQWTLYSGALPAGVTLSSGGLISGTPTVVGSFNFSVEVRDAYNCFQRQDLVLAVECPPMDIDPDSLPEAVVGQNYNQQLTVTGGVPGYTWSRTSGAFPTGMSINSSGLISGIPTSAAGNYSVTITARDSNNCPAVISYVLTLRCPDITVSPLLTNGVIGEAISETFDATGGTAPYTWSVASGSTLPAGLTLSPSGGLGGVPEVTGANVFTIQASDVFGCVKTADVTVNVSCPALVLAPASLPWGMKGVAYNQTVSTTKGKAPYTYSVVAGSLPPGISLTGTNGLISGTPTATGSSTFTLLSVDGAGCSGTRDFTIDIHGIKLGNIVWNDLDQGGDLDAGETGIPGVGLALYSTVDSTIGNADDQLVTSMTSGALGDYSFAGLAPGKYYVQVTAPTAQPYSSGPQVNADDLIDNDNNALQPSGSGTLARSPLITLSPGQAPGTLPITNLGDNLTVDFGFRAMPTQINNLLEYTLNASSGGLPVYPSYKNPCVVNAAKIQIEDDMNGLADISEPTSNGPVRGGALSRRMRGWDGSYDLAYDSPPTLLNQRPDSLWLRFDMDPTATGTVGRLLFDINRTGSTSPVQGKAILSWKDGSVTRSAATSTFTLSAVSSWYSLQLAFDQFMGGATALPTGAGLAGRSFLLELYLWGGDGSGYIDIDNLLLEGSATCSPPSLSIGDYVWADTNCNGLKNPKEPGLPGLAVQLWQPGVDGLPDTGDDQMLQTTQTDANGYYLFSGLPAGNYYVRLPVLNPEWPTAAPADPADNGEDNDSNGLQSGGIGSPVRSPVIQLAFNAEPGVGGSTNQEMTIDFGFCASLVMGNLVWSDEDNDGLFDAGEDGVANAQLALFKSTDTTVNNGNDTQIGTAFTTGADGAYSFSGLSAGYYYIRLTPPITHPRRSSVSTSADNGVDGDNNGITQSATGAPIYSGIVTLSALTEPGSLVAPFGGNADNTIDFGLRPTYCSLGNMVYKDGDNDGRFDFGEGIGSVVVELFDGNGVFLQSTLTSGSFFTRGRYQFTGLLPGDYYVRIPASEFGSGKPLVNTVSITPALPNDDNRDDNLIGNDNGLDNAQPATNGISSNVITLADSSEPINSGSETGASNTLDDGDDNNGNMTVDLGFKAATVNPTACYHFFLSDANLDGTLLERVSEWQPDQSYDFNYSAVTAYPTGFDVIYDAALARVKLDAVFQQIGAAKVDAVTLILSTGSDPATAQHAILYLDATNRAAPRVTMYRYNTSLGLSSWQTASNILLSNAPGSTTAGDVLEVKATEVGANVRFEMTLNLARVNNGSNWTGIGVDPAQWQGMIFGSNAGVVLQHHDLSAAPTYNAAGALTAFNSASNGSFVTDPAGVEVVVTELCPSSPWVCIGNLVYSDTNLNGVLDGAESGISGVSVQLFSPGTDGVIGGSGSGADYQVGSTFVTGASGAYSFVNLVPGPYYVRVSPPVFYPITGGNVVTSDNRVNNDNNGSQPGGVATFIYSPVIMLTPGAEPDNAVDGDDANCDATIDFGLFTGITVGSHVWNDENNNGLRDSGTEMSSGGITGVQMDLMSTGADGLPGGTGINADTLVRTASSGANGLYSLRTYVPGTYYVRFTPPALYPLASSTAVQADNGVNEDNNGVQTGGAGTEIRSMVFTLTAGAEPAPSGITNAEDTIDFGLRPCGTITLSSTPSPLTDAQRFASYSAAFSAAGGTSPYVFSLASGVLPDGFTLSSGGVLSSSSVTAMPANYSLNIRVVDAANCSTTGIFPLNVVCANMALSPTSLATAKQRTSFSQQFTVSGSGTAPFTYTLQSGTLPAGVTLAAGGLLSGTINGAPGNYNFTVRVTDVNGCYVQAVIPWTILCPDISISPTSVGAAKMYQSYGPVNFTANGANAPVLWSYTGTLPSGMTLNSAGSLGGTPTSSPGTYNITLTATDAASCSASIVLPVVVQCPDITILNSSPLADGVKGSAYSDLQLNASGGSTPYQWSLIGGQLPAGLSLSTSGLISGTVTAQAGAYDFTVRVTDAVNCSATKPLRINVVCPLLDITPGTLPPATQYATYSQNLSVSGGASPYAWVLDNGVMPPGISFSNGGVLSGTPTTLGSYTFDVGVSDSDGCYKTKRYTLTVDCPPITITPPVLPIAQRKVAYSQQLSASGGTAPYRFSVQGGSTLPTGLSISTAGLISGTCTDAPGSYNFVIQVLDANDCPGTQPFTLMLECGPISISPASLTDGVVGTSYLRTLTASGGEAPYTWTLNTGALPAGLTLATNGVISGTPTEQTTAFIRVETTDIYGCKGSIDYNFSVICPAVTLSPPDPLPHAYLQASYDQQITATGGHGPYVFDIIAGALPAGMTMNNAGRITGTPTVFGYANFTVRARDAYNCPGTLSYTLQVKGLGLGDIIYEDNNFNGLHDNGEAGVKDVTVELWDAGDDAAIGGAGSNSDVLITSQTTGALGQYHFDNLLPSAYFIRVLPPATLPIPGGNPVNLDNGVDLDNNGASQPSGPGTAIYSPVIALAAGVEPTVDDADSDTDFTVDVGLFRGMTLGNRIWHDFNDNGTLDVGENGLDGVTVQVWSTGADLVIGGTDDTLLRTTMTTTVLGVPGTYSFTALAPGKLYVRIPTPPDGYSLSSSVTTMADNGIDNDDNGIQVSGG
ncbi:MAG: putative Ig domain-containing protein [Verrucomicrobiaceae bacterium]|nr:putative Ig domain-containing protein [Verrucomicrobiaceae bacterium]